MIIIEGKIHFRSQNTDR